MSDDPENSDDLPSAEEIAAHRADLERMGDPVDADTFGFAMGVYQAAAKGDMVGAHIPRPDPDQPGLYLSNIPINRGMLAVMRETRHLNNAQRMALTMRLMEFGQVMERARADSRFAEHFKDSGDADSVMVSSAYHRAYAQVPFQLPEMTVDLTALYQLAEQFRLAEEKNE